MTKTKVLIAALSSTGFISLAPNLILLAFPQYASGDGSGSSVMSLGQALAAGGLLGDVFLHTLPHVHDMEEEKVGIWVLVGFTIFLIVDMLMRSGSEEYSDHHHHNGHNNHNGCTSNGDTTKKKSSTLEPVKTTCLTPTVLLNLAADALHNFTDGLAIGASFALQDKSSADSSFAALFTSRGGLATLSILFHEIPHELGDFCTLVKAGCSKKEAILAQFGTAVAAMIGTVVGVFAIEGFGGDRLLHFTAGGFVYLAAVAVLPEVLNDRVSMKFRIAQIAAFCTGVACLYAVALMEEHDHDHHHHHHGHAHGHAHDEHDHKHHHRETHAEHHHEL